MKKQIITFYAFCLIFLAFPFLAWAQQDYIIQARCIERGFTPDTLRFRGCKQQQAAFDKQLSVKESSRAIENECFKKAEVDALRFNPQKIPLHMKDE